MSDAKLLLRLAGLGLGRSEHLGKLEFVCLDAAGEEEPHDVEVSWSVENLGSRLYLHADIEGTARSRCDRCLVVFARRLAAEFDLVLQESAGSGVEFDDGIVSVPAHTVEFDLAPHVREAVILEEPIQVLCVPACRGLCARCGADLNQSPCGCAAAEDSRREPLQRLWPPSEPTE